MRSLAIASMLVMITVFTGSVAAQEDAFYTVSKVDYYYSLGAPATASATWGLDHAVDDRADFAGCTWAKIRPDKQSGRISTIATLQGQALDIEFSSLFGGTQGSGVSTGETISSSRWSGPAEFPAVQTSVEAWGNATMSMSDVLFTDPVTGSESFRAHWFVTDQGFRDDVTGQTLAKNGEVYQPGDAAKLGNEDWEMHLRIQSDPNAARQPDQIITIEQPAAGPMPYMQPDEAHQQAYGFINERFGGNGTLEIDTSSLSSAGMTELEFSFIAPNGTVLDEVSLAPALGSSDTHRVEFPLDAFGQYVVMVEGSVNLARYDITITQETPENFELDMWWDQVLPGYHGFEAKSACDSLMRGESVTGLIVAPIPPTSFNWISSLMTIAAFAVTGFIVTAFVIGVRSGASMLAAVRGS